MESESGTRMVTVVRALVNIKVGKPDDMPDQMFDEMIDEIYVEFRNCIDARDINAQVKAMRTIALNNFDTSVEVL